MDSLRDGQNEGERMSMSGWSVDVNDGVSGARPWASGSR